MKKAFTLMETLVAITLLLLAIGGPLYAVSQSLASAIYARDQITSFYLAQDAVEYIRNLRDNNALSNLPWNTGFNSVAFLPNDGSKGGGFNIDTTSGAITACPHSDGSGNPICDPMNYDSRLGVYTYGGAGTPSVFTRTIQLQKVDKNQFPTTEIRLIVDISWKSNIPGAKNDFKIVENLTSWVQ